MARYFDAAAALAELREDPIRPIHPTEEPNCRTNRVNRVPPDTDAFEERAAIAEYDGGLARGDAEDLAARAQGFGNVVGFRAAVIGRVDD